MLRRLAPYLLAVLVAMLTTAVVVIRPAVGAPERSADYVIMVGVAGLRWEDVDKVNTPTLWKLAEQGSIGSLSVRSAHHPTCPADGWVTLGAGNYAERTTATTTGTCPPIKVTVETPDGIGANLPDQKDDVVVNNRDNLPWGAMPGALAESVRCTVAVGTGAAIAAARPFGRVDRYEAKLPGNPAELLSSCVLSMVDLGTVAGEDQTKRKAAAHKADVALATVLAARPERSLLLIAGLSDTDISSRLHVVIADGPGWDGGWLSSASTERSGYLQLVDLAPTALAALGKPAPVGLFAGHPARSIDGRPTDLNAAVTLPADADREAGAQRGIVTWFFGLLVGVLLVLFLGAIPMLRRARRPGPPATPGPSSSGLLWFRSQPPALPSTSPMSSSGLSSSGSPSAGSLSSDVSSSGSHEPADPGGLAGQAGSAGQARLAGRAGLAGQARPAGRAELAGQAGLAGRAELAGQAGLAEPVELAGPKPVPRRLVTVAEVLLVAGALAIPAALAADAVPWWRTAVPGLVFAATTLLILALATVLVVVSRPYRHTLGPMGLVGALAAVVVGVDVLTGARLQLNGVAGYSALEGGRYAGVGTVGLGVFTAGTLLAAGCLAQLVRRAWRPPILVGIGGVGVMIVGSPYLGADASGAVALTAGVCIAVAVCLGGWLTFARLAWATFAGLAVTTGFALLDLRRPVEDRGSLGRFVGQLTDGSAGMSVQRTGAANVLALGSTPLTALALGAAVFVWFALLRPWGGLKRLYGLNPAVRAAMAGTAVASVMGGLLSGAALTVAGAAAATAVPLATLAALRVLQHASDRTQVPLSPPTDPSTEPSASQAAAGAMSDRPPGASAADVPSATSDGAAPSAGGTARPVARRVPRPAARRVSEPAVTPAVVPAIGPVEEAAIGPVEEAAGGPVEEAAVSSAPEPEAVTVSSEAGSNAGAQVSAGDDTPGRPLSAPAATPREVLPWSPVDRVV